MDKEELKTCLMDMCFLLDEEKKVLINNEPDKVQGIIYKKEALISKINKFDKKINKSDKDLVEIIDKMRELQETNQLLTQQALSFQNNIIEELSTDSNKFSGPYLSSGEYMQNDRVNFINKKI